MAASRMIILEIFDRNSSPAQELPVAEETARLLAMHEAMHRMARFSKIPTGTHDKPFQWS